jgi:hypothetical protein
MLVVRTAPATEQAATNRVRTAISADSLRAIWRGQHGEKYTREPDAELLQRSSARYGLGQSLGQFIEFVVHNFPFVLDLSRSSYRT